MNSAPPDVSPPDASVSVDLPYHAPFAWPRLLAFLGGRAIDGA
jgi:hypothetical protein